MRFNKKASMELGISTVVVLVIAMVIIAGGIAFIRGFFKLGTDKLGGAFNVGDFGIQPTSVDPLVLVDGAIALKSGATKDVKIGFYNKLTGEYSVNIVFGQCVSAVGDMNIICSGDSKVPIMTSLAQNVKPGESAGFKTYLTAACKGNTNTPGDGASNLIPGEYICQLKAVNAAEPNTVLAESQITITVLN
ncbi:MAG: hypothetical protein ACP5N2_05290 [Candidatus Nanoarchaeia archaeon]